MNTLFVDIEDFKSYKKNVGIYSFFKYKLDFDILSHGIFYNNINLEIDINPTSI